MKLQNLEIVNIGVHKHLRVRFGDGLTGILGPQGSGKSTVIGCVYAAITNDFSRISDLKQNAICQQAEENKSSLAVQLEANGNQVSITRTLAPHAGNKLLVSTGVMLTNDNKIKEEMAAILGASRGLLDNYVFVDQWEVRSLFRANYSQRSEALALLCGTKFMDACYGVISKARDCEKESIYDGLEDANRLASELNEYQLRLSKEIDNLRNLQSRLLDKSELEKLSDIAAKISLEINTKDSIEAVKSKLAEARKNHRGLYEECQKLAYNLAKTSELEASKRNELELARLNQGLYEAQAFKWNIKTGLQDKLESLELDFGKSPPTIDAGYTIEEYDKEISRIDSEAAPFVAIINHFKKLPDSQTCPTCHAPLTELKAKEKIARAAAAPLLEQKALYLKARAERQKQEAALKEFLESRYAIKDSIEKYRNELSLLDDITCPSPPDIDLKSLEAEHKIHLALLEKLRKEHTISGQDLAKLSSTISHLDSQRQDLESSLTELSSADIKNCKAQAILEEDQKNRQLAAASEARCEEYQKIVSSRKSDLEKVKALKIKSQKTRKWVDLLTRASSVLHKDGLPKVVHSRALREVESEVNKTLSEFESPFRIRTGENLTYIAKFCNGTEVPAHRLSGGQQVVLSLAMRWAFNSLFASQIGFLALDEPTAGLDEQHLGLLQSTLSKLGAAARNKGCQVVIITHEKRLMNVFDHVIELNRPVL